MARVLSDLVHHLGRVAARDGLAHLADHELVRRFAEHRDPLAFEVLVWRHGAMVLGVCGRVLGRGDADDAFQATFLALVRHARAVRAGQSLAGWLYRVARRVSLRVARQRVRRLSLERLAARSETVIADEAEWSDWRSALDREVERLPARYRDAFVLCHLEGRAHEDAARELGCPLGTLHSRLARAKEQLRRRLSLSGMALPLVLPGAVSARLVSDVVAAAAGLAGGSVIAAAPAAVALSQGVWNPMTFMKVKLIGAVVLAAAVVGSGIGVRWQPTAAASSTPISMMRPLEDPAIEALKRENERLRREVADLKKQLGDAEAKLTQVAGDPPTDAEVLKALPRAVANTKKIYEEFRDDVVIVKKRLVDKLDPPRVFPKIGPARLWHQHWECTVYYTETIRSDYPFPQSTKKKRVQVVYIDKDSLVITPESAK
jgi:RNA polymerase sigma factor (sigma-70 family)